MINVNELYKGYGKTPVIKNISLYVEKGEIHGIIGENSAGKTTLIKCMAGIYSPDNGSVTLDGRDVYDNVDAKERIAYISDVPDFIPCYSVKRTVNLYNNYFKSFSIDKFNKYNEIFEIPLSANASRLSKGQKMRLNIMLEMSKGAEYIIMDEPSSGLDPVARGKFFDMIVKEVDENGTGIFISSHNLDGLEKICDTVSIICKGEIESNKKLDEVRSGIKQINAVFENGLPDEISKMSNVCNIKNTGKIYSFAVENCGEDFTDKLKKLGAVYAEEFDLSLEDYFIALDSFKENKEA